MRKKFFYAMILAACCTVFVCARFHLKGTGAQAHLNSGTTSTKPDFRTAFTNRNFVLYSPVDSNMVHELKSAFNGIVVAYSNRQVMVMRDIYSQLPEEVKRIPIREYDSICSTARKVFFDEFLMTESVGDKIRNVPDFHETSEFCRYFETIFEMAKILGQITVDRSHYSALDSYEGLPLCHLETYRQKFKTENRAEFVKCIDELETRLKNRIDSKDSFAYLGVRRFYENNLGLVGEGELTMEEMLKNARFRCLFLIVNIAGYEPKWLDEFK